MKVNGKCQFMKKGFLTHIIFLLAFTLLSSRNYGSRVTAASSPDTLDIQRSYSIGCEDLGGPAVGPDGVIYVDGHSGYIHAVNPNGTERWKRPFPVSLPEEEKMDGIPVSICDAIGKGFDLETMLVLMVLFTLGVMIPVCMHSIPVSRTNGSLKQKVRYLTVL